MSYEWVDCYHCGGSGEGMFDGTTCRVCKGRGETLEEIDDEPDDEEVSEIDA